MPWTTEQKIFIVEAYFRQKSIHAAQLQFKERFGCREFPVHSMIYRWVNEFRTHGTVHNLNHKQTITLWTTEIIKDTTQRCCCQRLCRLCCPLPKQVCALAKSGAWNQPGGCAENFDRHLVDGEGSSGSSSGSSRMAPPPPQTNHWHGYSRASLTDWSAAGVTSSGRRIHRTWTPQIFICGDTLNQWFPTCLGLRHPVANPYNFASRFDDSLKMYF